MRGRDGEAPRLCHGIAFERVKLPSWQNFDEYSCSSALSVLVFAYSLLKLQTEVTDNLRCRGGGSSTRAASQVTSAIPTPRGVYFRPLLASQHYLVRSF